LQAAKDSDWEAMSPFVTTSMFEFLRPPWMAPIVSPRLGDQDAFCTQWPPSVNGVSLHAQWISIQSQEIKQTIGSIIGLGLQVVEVHEQVVDIDALDLRDILDLDTRTCNNKESLHFTDRVVKTVLPHALVTLVVAINTPARF
jgi:hypothetical protein